MTKKGKKLILARETLRDLGVTKLGEVAGGYTRYTEETYTRILKTAESCYC
jgi:hypothetical protein